MKWLLSYFYIFLHEAIMNLAKQQGFTLIELVMVIVILGILAATALPKFVDMTSSARQSTLKGLEGAIQGAKSLSKAAYLITPGATITLSDGTTVAVVNTTGATAGYPLATAPGIKAAIDISGDLADTYATGPNVATFTLITNCFLTYTESTGKVAQTISGC
jgi:MSHA pilin protein MshA